MFNGEVQWSQGVCHFLVNNIISMGTLLMTTLRERSAESLNVWKPVFTAKSVFSISPNGLIS